MARRKTAQELRIETLLADLEPSVIDAFLAAVHAQRGAIDLSALEAALARGDVFGAFEMLRANATILFPLTDAVRAGYIAGGLSVAESLPIKIRGQFGFGGNPRAEQAVQRITGTLIQHINDSTLDMVRGVFATGVRDGVPPRRQALDIVGRVNKVTGLREGGFLGLDDSRADQVRRVQDMLADPDRIRDYFVRDRKTGRMKPRYKTTSRSYDRRVLKAIKEGRALGKRDIADISHHHRARLLRDRGETIARTETLNALRAGQHDGFGTLIDTGVVMADEMTKKWLATTDGRTRDSHRSLGGTIVTFNELFDSPTGARMAHPGDTANGAGAKDVIQCRCAAVYRIKRKT